MHIEKIMIITTKSPLGLVKYYYVFFLKKKNHKKKAINIAKCTVLPAKVRLKDLKPGSSSLLI